MLKIVKRDDVGFSSVVKEALDNQLFIPGKNFEDMLTYHTDYITALAIAYEEVPIALAMHWYYPEPYGIAEEQMGCFVKEEFRRQGHGTRAIKALGTKECRTGESGSSDFWSSLC